MALIFKINKPNFVSSIKYKHQETTSFIWEYQQNFDLNFKLVLRDITTEEGYYVLESCQNVEVIF